MQLPMVLRVLLLVTTQGRSKSCIITKCCPKRKNKVTIIDMKKFCGVSFIVINIPVCIGTI